MTGAISQAALDAALAVVPKEGHPDIRQDANAELFLFDYTDGFRGAIFMLSCVHGTSIGVKLKVARARSPPPSTNARSRVIRTSRTC